jgi:DNA-directed RNA polymerase specialized sigma24 family protein
MGTPPAASKGWLAIPIGTVMSRLNKGRNMLAQMLVEPEPLQRAA